MERLTDKFKCKNNTGKIVNAHNVSKQQVIDKLSEYEDTGLTPQKVEELTKENAELKSRLEKSVELPCKVGDMVYDMKYGEVNAWKITLILHWENEIHINSECKVFLPCEFGKNVFLTKEEAEQALKGGADDE